jgi:hypothetical protein
LNEAGSYDKYILWLRKLPQYLLEIQQSKLVTEISAEKRKVVALLLRKIA